MRGQSEPFGDLPPRPVTAPPTPVPVASEGWALAVAVDRLAGSIEALAASLSGRGA